MKKMNEFKITISCKHEVYRGEWLELLTLLNQILQTELDGKFSNVVANLEEVT